MLPLLLVTETAQRPSPIFPFSASPVSDPDAVTGISELILPNEGRAGMVLPPPSGRFTRTGANDVLTVTRVHADGGRPAISTVPFWLMTSTLSRTPSRVTAPNDVRALTGPSISDARIAPLEFSAVRPPRTLAASRGPKPVS